MGHRGWGMGNAAAATPSPSPIPHAPSPITQAGGAMTKAYVLIKAEIGRVGEIQAHLRAVGIPQVDIVAGNFSLIAVLEAEDPRQIGQIVMDQIQHTPGVLDTVTLLQIG